MCALPILHALGLDAVRLKWPNDLVVVDGGRPGSSPGQVLRKLGGLLVEGSGEHAGPVRAVIGLGLNVRMRSEEHTSELQSLMRSSYAVFCLKKKTNDAYDTEQNTLQQTP